MCFIWKIDLRMFTIKIEKWRYTFVFFVKMEHGEIYDFGLYDPCQYV